MSAELAGVGGSGVGWGVGLGRGPGSSFFLAGKSMLLGWAA